MSKRAFLVGINNFRGVTPLQGCINDTLEMQGLLKTYYGFQDRDVRILHDRDATAQGIRDGLAWLLRDYDGGDVRVFHFSSHGTQVNDQTADEWEAFDEVIVPHDHDWSNPFRDDDLREIFMKIPQNVNFTFVADCCHSGSIQRELLDRKIEFTPRFITPPQEIKDCIRQLEEKRDAEADAWASQELAKLLKDVPPDQWAAKMQEYLPRLRKRFQQNKFAMVAADRDFLLAACEDRQTAADARIEGKFQGAFTWGLSKAIKEANGNLTYNELITRASANLQDYEQKPQLECPDGVNSLKAFAPLP